MNGHLTRREFVRLASLAVATTAAAACGATPTATPVPAATKAPAAPAPAPTAVPTKAAVSKFPDNTPKYDLSKSGSYEDGPGRRGSGSHHQ